MMRNFTMLEALARSGKGHPRFLGYLSTRDCTRRLPRPAQRPAFVPASVDKPANVQQAYSEYTANSKRISAKETADTKFRYQEGADCAVQLISNVFTVQNDESGILIGLRNQSAEIVCAMNPALRLFSVQSHDFVCAQVCYQIEIHSEI